jgi:hypothetical protein
MNSCTIDAVQLRAGSALVQMEKPDFSPNKLKETNIRA